MTSTKIEALGIKSTLLEDQKGKAINLAIKMIMDGKSVEEIEIEIGEQFDLIPRPLIQIIALGAEEIKNKKEKYG